MRKQPDIIEHIIRKQLNLFESDIQGSTQCFLNYRSSKFVCIFKQIIEK